MGPAPFDKVRDHKTSLVLCKALPDALQETQQHTALEPLIELRMSG